MNVVAHRTACDWLARVSPLLLTAEAENNLMLGLAAQAIENPLLYPDGLLLLSIEDATEIVGAALATRPQNLIISRQPEPAIAKLIDGLVDGGTVLPGVIGPVETTEAYARRWAERTGTDPRIRMRQRIYDCARVILKDRSPGRMRLASEADVPQLARWSLAFHHDVGAPHIPPDPEAVIHRMLTRQSTFVWERDGTVVSCAAIQRRTPNGAVITFVYTPPGERGRGYATSCVAELTAATLQDGAKFCCLYTDLANSTSNAIYARIGYQPVCDSSWWEFAHPSR